MAEQINIYNLDFETVSLNEDGTALVLVDQTKLPNSIEVLRLTTQSEIWQAIHLLQVRGAPAIGVAAAGGLYLAAKDIEAKQMKDFYKEFAKAKAYLASSRPTAVNLFWALDRMEQVVLGNYKLSPEQIKALLFTEAMAIKNEDIACCRQIGINGLPLIKDCKGILTHCNAGRLAAVKYGTALAPIYIGKEQGYGFKVFADETRPLLQGARLTAFELTSAGVDTTVICDNMAATVMQKGWVQAVIVGADRIALNGDTANKIGTNGLAILAKHYNIPFYVAAPTSTFDVACPEGSKIQIEERDPKEVKTMWYDKPMIPEGAKIYNPAFDITSNQLITAIITEKGVVKPPFARGIKKLFI